MRHHNRRQVLFSVFGPSSVIVLLAIWAFSLILGFGLLHWGLHSQVHLPQGDVLDFGSLLYMSGTTFFTLGLGDVTAINPLGRTLIVLESATGFIFLALIIGYMPMLEQAFNEREGQVLMLQSKTGTPQSALRLLKSLHGADSGKILQETLHDAEAWMAALLESHMSHPLLAYYRSQILGFSWLISMTTLMDTCAILLASEGGTASFQTKSTFRLGSLVAIELAGALSMQAIYDSSHERAKVEWRDLCLKFASDGIELSSSPEAAERFARLRSLYEPYLMAMGKKLHIELPEWAPMAPEEKPWPDFLDFAGVKPESN